jgi:hypothetical protein
MHRTDDPRAYADDLHRMDWSDYLQTAEDWKAKRAHRAQWPWRSVASVSVVVIAVMALLAQL